MNLSFEPYLLMLLHRKREDLIKQIQRQATEIQRLIEDLEASNTPQRSEATSPSASQAPISPNSSPFRSPSSGTYPDSEERLRVIHLDIQEWIDTARENTAKFNRVIELVQLE
ncbi:hypothetical protein GLOTRDRAFT_131805 [Gloeophyllum trabeum ATCC 11539]|uniref:Uncharacterized protein n=1 Tax=Gloeophyllum trabeum (strain ATCC 11539 / FP-39264 / Madison 617) TaxID=670483 RepID=S7PYP4_GLOTA|nr:uncharacterized protein GLOTRDRAFT_131805 [Gloeophyllum trabeum ATCC 11539]EPQ52573.1 hypothetical protein GLOTRDRAFT_131805 [Gloeophyllum trabeum ATCC 11539]